TSVLSSLLLVRRPAGLTPFPYTTLFRSKSHKQRVSSQPGPGLAGRALRGWVGGVRGRRRRLSPLRLRRRCRTSSRRRPGGLPSRSEEHTSELQSRENLVCRLLLEKKKHK